MSGISLYIMSFYQRIRIIFIKHPDSEIRPGQIGAQNLWASPEYFGKQIFPFKREKIIRSVNFQSNRWSNEKVPINSKYYGAHYRLQYLDNIKTDVFTYKLKIFS